LLGQLARPDRTVVADFEAGLGTVLRLEGSPVDVVVVVVEPTAKSLEVGRRAVEAVTASGLGVVVTANRVRDGDDIARVRTAFPGHEPVLVPDEPAIVDAERQGLSPLDAAPDAPGVGALVELAQVLLREA
jgi:CO dehydrogenase maturation factor